MHLTPATQLSGTAATATDLIAAFPPLPALPPVFSSIISLPSYGWREIAALSLQLAAAGLQAAAGPGTTSRAVPITGRTNTRWCVKLRLVVHGGLHWAQFRYWIRSAGLARVAPLRLARDNHGHDLRVLSSRITGLGLLPTSAHRLGPPHTDTATMNHGNCLMALGSPHDIACTAESFWTSPFEDVITSRDRRLGRIMLDRPTEILHSEQLDTFRTVPSTGRRRRYYASSDWTTGPRATAA